MGDPDSCRGGGEQMTAIESDGSGLLEPHLERLAGLMETALTQGSEECSALAGPLRSTLIAGGRSNPTYEISDGVRRWVLRRPPYGAVIQSAHDMDREARVISALAESAVPVPRVVLVCDDPAVLGAPFYVMDRLDGITLRTHQDTAALTPAQRSGLTDAMLDILVSLHETDPVDVGLADWGRPDGYLARQVRRWGRQWDQVKTGDRPEVAELLDRLTRALPMTRFPGIVHGDYKIDNVMVARDDSTRIIGVLDWEMATLGDTLADLGFLVSFWDEPGMAWNPITAGATAHPGFPSAAEVVTRYAERRGIQIDDLEWYVVFSDFKLAVILEQIHARHLQGRTVGAGFDDIGGMVEPLLSRALERASASANPQLRR